MNAPRRWEDGRGWASVERAGPRVVKVTMSGFVRAPIGRSVAEALSQQLAGQREQHTFWNLGELTAYDAAVREACTDALRDHWAAVASVHTFTRSRIVQLGIGVARIALGGKFVSCPDQEAFDRALAKLLVPG